MSTPRFLYIFLDEAGNLDFSSNGSKYFVLGGITKERPFHAYKELTEFKYDQVERGTALEYFHASENTQAVRNGVFDIIEKNLAGVAVDAIIVEKQKVDATLRAEEGRARNAIATYEKGLSTEPNVEREFTQLQREYDNSRSRYEDLQTKMKNAALARTMEAQDRGERFALLHAPTPPRHSYYPNRLGIILLGLVLGLGLAAQAISFQF